MKLALHKPRLTVVVDFGRGSIKLATAETAGEAVRFRGITRIPLPHRGLDDEPPSVALLGELIGAEVGRRGWRGMPAACLLSGAATSTQSFLFPPMPDSDLREALELKLADRLHFEVEEACFDFRRVREVETEHGPQVLTLLVAAQRKAVDDALAVLRRAGLQPVAVGASSESLANLTYYASQTADHEVTVHADVGADSTILNLFEGRLLRFSREVDLGGEAFTRALMRPILTRNGPVNLTHMQAEEVKFAAGYPLDDQRDDEELDLPHGVKASEILPVLEPVAQRLTAEIRRSMDYLRGITSRSAVDRVVLSGPAAAMRNLQAMLEEHLGTSVVRVDPVGRATDHWRLAICDEDPPSPVGFGAILGYSLGNHHPINLMPREERIQELVERTAGAQKAAMPAAVAVGLTLALAAVPIDRTYGLAAERMEGVRVDLERRLGDEEALAARLESVRTAEQLVRAARGGVPHWTGVLQELAAILPPGVELRSLAAERDAERTVLRLMAAVAPGPEPMEAVLTRTTHALGASPFFANVHVVSAVASIGSGGGAGGMGGDYEATVELVTPPVGRVAAEEERE